jgi:hypothetical protein
LVVSTNSAVDTREVSDKFCKYPLGWMSVQCAHGTQAWAPLRCRRCSGCRLARRVKIMRKVGAAIGETRPMALLTLTTTPGTTWPVVMKKWSSMIRALRKLSGSRIEYAACKEEGAESGMKHLHVLLVEWKYVRWSVISELWEGMIGARGVDIRAIKQGEGAVAYITKYLGKWDPEGEVKKALTYSSGFPKPQDAEVPKFVGAIETTAKMPEKAMLSTSGMILRGKTVCECFGEELGLMKMRGSGGGLSYEIAAEERKNGDTLESNGTRNASWL